LGSVPKRLFASLIQKIIFRSDAAILEQEG